MSKKIKYHLISEKELKQIEEKIKSELEPFLDGIRTKRADFKLFKQAYEDFITRHNHAYEIFEFVFKDFGKFSKFETKDQIHELFLYLGLVESVGNLITNIVTLLLIANGKDFHIECRHTSPSIKHVTSIGDLEDERVPLITRLNFLRQNGIEELASILDSGRELRNIIAHLRFKIEKNGVYVKGKPAVYYLLNSGLKMLRAIKTVELLLVRFAKEKGLPFAPLWSS